MNLHEIVPGNFFTFAVRKMTSLHSMRAGAPNLNFGHHYVNHGAKIILSTFSYYACSCKHDHLPKMVALNNNIRKVSFSDEGSSFSCSSKSCISSKASLFNVLISLVSKLYCVIFQSTRICRVSYHSS